MTFNGADPGLACIQKALLAHMWPQTSCPAQEKIAPRKRAWEYLHVMMRRQHIKRGQESCMSERLLQVMTYNNADLSPSLHTMH